ncbi:maleylacetoacetate isomerase [Undibacterium terreum]|uniref:Maleylacetoacetate isomerase n=1 Tax=Undibacterium terreum TaxID=1224302 RepID=A0A916USW2_9BURK|nr:maleylacetoacetate isomerase [Undibacterium terreum]GGC85779.1 maleylacetoacetate isomerase [Undibacterium terreum]
MKLYSYFRSSASYRVRVVLNLKGLDYETVPIHLVKNGGEQHSDSFRAINPEELVPAFCDMHEGRDVALTQSLAIIEYLEEAYPEIPVLPANAIDRAHVRSLALSVACEIHPVNNLRVLRYLTKDLGFTEEQKNAWYRHWCEAGMAALEQKLAADPRTGRFCFGDTPTLADCCLVPQVFNAQRFNCDLSRMPTIMRINQACLELNAFIKAAPASQPDAE